MIKANRKNIVTYIEKSEENILWMRNLIKYPISIGKMKNAILENEWDFGNNILYKLCSDYPCHNRKEVVIAKLLFIGRIYAAALERRRNKKESGDNFYIKKAAPVIVKSLLDRKLSQIGIVIDVKNRNVLDVLRVHKYLVDLFHEISGLEKRSLGSKYLHFHKPDLFFIYDSRAVNALSKIKAYVPKDYKLLSKSHDIDEQYAKYCLKSLIVKKDIERKIGKTITIRQFDKILMRIAEDIGRNKKS